MNIEEYIFSMSILAVIIGAPTYLAVQIRRKFYAFLDGPDAILATVIIAVSFVFLVSSLLGVVNLFSLVPIVISCGFLGLVGIVCRIPPSGTVSNVPGRAAVADGKLRGMGRPTVLVLSLVIVATVLTQWASHVAEALTGGVRALDSLLYHLPYAAHFVQSGQVTGAVYYLADQPTPFYPRNMELLHGIGMSVFGSEFLSAFMNFALLVLLLLAAWCVGRSRGVAPIAVSLAAIAAAVPIISSTQGGGANVDLAPAAFGVACISFLLQISGHLEAPGRDPRQASTSARLLFLAALAAGLAISSKISALPFFGLLTVAVLFCYRHLGPVVVGRAWLGGLVLTGSFWYLLNIAHVGNPFPFVEISLGPLRLPAPDWSALAPIQSSIAQQLPNTQSWAFFANGLAASFGRGWPLVIALVSTGVVAALRSRDRSIIMLGAVTLGSAICYIFTPYTGGGPPGLPLFFTQGLRYAFVTVICGLLLVSFLRTLQRPAAQCVFSVALLAMLALTYIPPSRGIGQFTQFLTWPSGISWTGVAWAGVAMVLLATMTWILARTSSPAAGRSYRPVTLVVAALLIAVATWPVQRQYLVARTQNGYTAAPSPLPAFLVPSYEFLRTVDGVTVGYSGVVHSYPIIGPDLGNRVVYLSQRKPHRGASDIVDCAVWMNELRKNQVDYVMIASLTGAGQVGPSEASQLQQLTWMQEAPGVRELVRREQPVQWGSPAAGRVSPPQVGAVFSVDLARLGNYSCGAM